MSANKKSKSSVLSQLRLCDLFNEAVKISGYSRQHWGGGDDTVYVKENSKKS